MPNQTMDLLPLIPGRDGTQNAVRAIREAFQSILDGKLYPKKVAEYIITCQVDEDLRMKENAEQVLQIYDSLNDIVETIENAGREIMEQQGSYMVKKDRIRNIQDLKERIRLQHCNLFKNIRIFYVDYFGLLQKSDLLPDAIRKCIDYRINEKLHLCKDCLNKLKKESKTPTTKDKYKKMTREETRRNSIKLQGNEMKIRGFRSENIHPSKLTPTSQKGTKQTTRSPITIIPSSAEFHNCEPGKTYKKTLKLLNTSTIAQSLAIKDFPKNRSLSVSLDINTKLACGMSCSATIVFKPEVYRNIQDVVSFRNQMGFVQNLSIKATRDPPKLITCIFKSNSCHMDRPKPGSARFVDARREALNSSIDCGSCMVGEYIYLSLFVQNNGPKGKFFIITEDEWYFENVESISTSMEHSSNSLWIYPTFFELNTSEIIQINILFYPFKKDMYLEKYFFMCDNNTFQQFEILGDGLMFSKRFLKIDVLPNDVDVDQKEDYCIFLGNFQPNTSHSLSLTVHNTSSLNLKCFWKLQNKRVRDIQGMDESWIEMNNCPTSLAPYSTTDFMFKINLNTTKEGFYSTFFNFFIADVPLNGLEKDEKFLVFERTSSGEILTKSVDVHFMEIEVACSIEIPKVTPTLSSQIIPTIPTTSPRPPKVGFSCSFLNFGILPNGVPVQKSFWVKNFSIEPTQWKIGEVKYNVDYTPFMKVVESKNISCNFGEFHCICKKKKIFYNVTKKSPVNWVSMLLLISMDKDTLFEIESICIVTYAIIDYDITINGSHNPVLCPMKILYTGVPHTLVMSIENHSPITGMFYFLKPHGESVGSVSIELEPQNAVLKPLESKLVELKIIGNEIGIFENIYILCFVNKGHCIVIRVLCAVDTIHLAMYLPGKNCYYEKIMWPPKIVFEYDDNWMICPCTLEYAPELSEMQSQTNHGKEDVSNHGSFKPGNNTPVASSNENDAAADEELADVTSGNKQSSETNSKSSSDSTFGSLREMLQEKFGDELFLQDHIVEVHQVNLRTPTNVTFYIENITPVETTYTVEAINFYTTKTFDKLAHKFRLKKTEDIWNDMIMNEYGILVLPDVKEAELSSFGLIEVTLTIFANTWGIYQEEIAVDVFDVPCFTFSLLIEVVGCPIIFPLAIGKTDEVPLIRFGNLAYCSEEIKRNIRIVNSSCIPLKVMWHNFLRTSTVSNSDTKFNMVFDIISNGVPFGNAKLAITDKYYGKESNTVFKVDPDELRLKESSSEYIEVTMTPENVPSRVEKTYARCSFLGIILLDKHHRKKPNYFFRHSSYVTIEVHATLELPVLRADFVCDETTMRFYANDVIFNVNYKESTKLIFQNSYTCSAKVEMIVDDPLEILDKESRPDGKHIYVVKPLTSLEVTVFCNIDHQRLLELSETVYPKKDVDIAEIDDKLGVHFVDRDLKIVHIKRNFRILQKGGTEQGFPMDLFIYFPYISVNPTIVNYDHVFLGNTRKTLVTVFNNTGCPVNFEIYKSLASEVLFITPHYGRIQGSTGANKSFFNIFVYFTPREARQYQESIRVVTNIPNYFVEIIIRATGTLNEKFRIEYKI